MPEFDGLMQTGDVLIRKEDVVIVLRADRDTLYYLYFEGGRREKLNVFNIKSGFTRLSKWKQYYYVPVK